MLAGAYVINAVVHPFDFSAGNIRPDDIAQSFVDGLWIKHQILSGGSEYSLRRDEFYSNFPADPLYGILFEESQNDMAILHALPDLGLFTDALCHIEPLVELRAKHPGRFLLYGTCQPYDLQAAFKSLEQQVKEYKIDGVKLYPASYYAGKTIGWRMDDADIALPLFRHIEKLGIRNVAVHKTVPLGRTRVEPFKVEDVEGAALAFPEMNFHVVHAGVAFLEDTAMLLARFPNVYANLEVTFNYVVCYPRVFAESVGRMLRDAPDRVCFGDGCNLVHPRPALDAFAKFEMPDDMVTGFGFPRMTDELRHGVLGANIARAHGLDIAALTKKAAAAPPRNLLPPWHAIRNSQRAH
jgi:uncharacterized protein